MALREILARFGVQVDTKQLAGANKGIMGAVGSLKLFGAAIAASAVVRGISNFVSDIVAQGDELGKTSKQLGIGVTALQEWQVAAQLSGASTKELTTGMRTLAKNALLAEQGSKQAADGFALLDIDVNKAGGGLKDANTLFRETGLALGAMENNTERVALAQQLLGRSGVKLLPLFKGGAEELDKLLGKLEEYGGGIGPEAVKLSEQAADEFLLFGIATDSLKSKLAVALLPIISQVTGALSRFISALSKLFGETNIVQAALTILASVLGRMGFAALAKIGIRGLLAGLAKLARSVLLPIAKFAILALVIDDMITFFRGGESVIGNVLDKIFGKGTAKVLVGEIKAISGALADMVINFGETNVVTDEFGTTIEDNETRFTKFASSLASSTDQIVKDFGEAWDLASADMGDWLSDIDQSLRDAMTFLRTGLTDFAEAAVDIGTAIIEGIVQGIKDGVGEVVDAVVGMAGKAVDAANDFFGNKSPSTVFAGIGKNNIDGLVMGMQKAAGGASRLGAAALGTASGMASAPARGGGGGRIARGGMMFKTEINIPITGGSPNDQQLSKLRQGLRKSLDDNRRATVAALTQVAEPLPV